MTYILDSEIVYVVIHMHCGVIFNTAVFAEYDDAIDYYHKMRIDCDEEFDDVDFQECKIIRCSRQI